MRHSGAPKNINNDGRAKADKQTEQNHTRMQVNAEGKEKTLDFTQCAHKLLLHHNLLGI